MRFRLVALFVLLVGAGGCTSPQETPVASEVVASWQDEDVSLAGFEATYFQFWQGSEQPDSPELRRETARQLLEQGLIARAALERGLDKKTYVRDLVRRDHERFVRRAYLEGEIESHIPEPADAEIRQALSRKNRRYFVRQLFALTPEEINTLENRLKRGEAFEQLARETLPDPQMARNEGRLGWLGWGDTDLPVEEVLYAMEVDEVSRPVESLMGWHILRVDSVEDVLEFGEVAPGEFEEVKAEILNRRLDMEAALHIREIVWGHDLAVDMKALQSIWPIVAERVTGKGLPEAQQGLQLLSEEAPLHIMDQVLATVNGAPFTARQFFYHLPDVPPNAFSPNLKKAVEVAIRDSIMTAVAIENGYDKVQRVQDQSARAQKTALFAAAMQSAQEESADLETDLEAFYSRNQMRYVDYAQTEVWEILMNHPDSARAVARAIHEGLAFEEAARRFTRRDSVRDEGGYLGFVRSDYGEIGARAAQLEPGALYGPVSTASGFSIIRTGIRVFEYLSLDEVRDQVAQDAEQMHMIELYRSLLPEGYNPADIIYNDSLLAQAFQ